VERGTRSLSPNSRSVNMADLTHLSVDLSLHQSQKGEDFREIGNQERYKKDTLPLSEGSGKWPAATRNLIPPCNIPSCLWRWPPERLDLYRGAWLPLT
jgi:hypothetical protein